MDAVEIISLFRVVTSRPNQTRGNGLRLRFGAQLDSPHHPARVLYIELRHGAFLDLFQETIRRRRRERLRSRSVEKIAFANIPGVAPKNGLAAGVLPLFL